MRTKRTHVFYDADSFSNPLFSCVNIETFVLFMNKRLNFFMGA